MAPKIVYFILACVAFTSCLNEIIAPNCLTGEGAVISDSRTLDGDFNAILHQIPGNVHITQGSTQSLVIEGQANLLPHLNSSINNEVLLLTFSECIESGMIFEVYITVTDLQAISLSGLGDISFENEIVSSRLELVINGQGNMDLRGAADTVDIVLAGQGSIKGFDLISDYCEILIAGLGDVEITANEELFVIINGQGNVYYKGMPAVVSEINGLGTVTDAN